MAEWELLLDRTVAWVRYSASPKLSSSLFFGWAVLWHQYQFTLWVSSTYYLLVFINCALSLFICFPVPFLSSCVASLLLYKHDGDGVSLLRPWWVWHLIPVMDLQLHSPFLCARCRNVQLVFFLVRRMVCTKEGKAGIALDRPVSKWFFYHHAVVICTILCVPHV